MTLRDEAERALRHTDGTPLAAAGLSVPALSDGGSPLLGPKPALPPPDKPGRQQTGRRWQQHGCSSAPRARLYRPRYKLTPKVKQPRRFAKHQWGAECVVGWRGWQNPNVWQDGHSHRGCSSLHPCWGPPGWLRRFCPLCQHLQGHRGRLYGELPAPAGTTVSKGTEQVLLAGPHRAAAEGCTAFSTALTLRDNKGDLTWRGSTELFGNRGVRRADARIRGCRPSVLIASPQASQAGGEQREPGCTHLCQSPGLRGRHRRSPPVFRLHPALPAQPRTRPRRSLGPAPAQPAAAQPA